MSLTVNTLIEEMLDMRRFETTDSKSISCWEVIEMILKPFNCKLKQHKGKYTITNFHELDSPEWVFAWDDLSQISKALLTKVIDTTSSKYSTYIEQQKIKPLKDVDITLFTKDVLEDVTGRNLSHFMTVWQKVGFLSWRELHAELTQDAEFGTILQTYVYTDVTAPYIQLSSTMDLAKITESDYISIKFETQSGLITSNTNISNTFIKIEIQRPDGLWYYGDVTPIWNYAGQWITYISTEQPGLRITENGNYNIRLSWTCQNPTNQHILWENKIQHIQITRTQKTVFDKRLIQSLSTNAKQTYNPQMHVADAYQITYIGGLLKYIEGTETWVVTENWNSYNQTEGIKLLDIYARNILNNRFRYKNFLRLTLHDRENIISFNNILLIEGRYYVWYSFERDYLNGTITGDIGELLITRQEYFPIRESILDTINGVKTEIST